MAMQGSVISYLRSPEISIQQNTSKNTTPIRMPVIVAFGTITGILIGVVFSTPHTGVLVQIHG
jgi:uncharacterized membrane protein